MGKLIDINCSLCIVVILSHTIHKAHIYKTLDFFQIVISFDKTDFINLSHLTL